MVSIFAEQVFTLPIDVAFVQGNIDQATVSSTIPASTALANVTEFVYLQDIQIDINAQDSISLGDSTYHSYTTSGDTARLTFNGVTLLNFNYFPWGISFGPELSGPLDYEPSSTDLITADTYIDSPLTLELDSGIQFEQTTSNRTDVVNETKTVTYDVSIKFIGRTP